MIERIAHGARASCWLLLASLLTSGCAALRGEPAREPEPEPAPSVPDADDADGGGVLASVGGLVERAQQGASARFDAFMFELDDFFAGDLQSDEPNTSYARLRLDAKKPALDNFELDPSIKLRVVLPRSEQRLRLLLDAGDDREANESEIASESPLDEQSLSLALRFVRRARTSGRLDFDLGARQREGLLQLYGRINAEYRDDLGKRGSLRLGNRYYYYARSGFENRLRLDLTRTLDVSRSRFLRSSTTADWRRGRQGASLGQVLGAYADLGERAAIAVEALAAYDTSLNGDVTDRYRGHELRVRYRQNVWRPWLFYEFWPAVAWPAERGYRRTWNGLLRLEITIGGESVSAPPAAAPAVPSG